MPIYWAPIYYPIHLNIRLWCLILKRNKSCGYSNTGPSDPFMGYLCNFGPFLSHNLKTEPVGPIFKSFLVRYSSHGLNSEQQQPVALHHSNTGLVCFWIPTVHVQYLQCKSQTHKEYLDLSQTVLVLCFVRLHHI